jgi:hypothetical protein
VAGAGGKTEGRGTALTDALASLPATVKPLHVLKSRLYAGGGLSIASPSSSDSDKLADGISGGGTWGGRGQLAAMRNPPGSEKVPRHARGAGGSDTGC